MQTAQRLIVNTIAQYTRTIINILLSLYSTRLVLDALGKGDYGIFQLVGGVVAMLGFLTNAMVITTQRHLSYAHGQGAVLEVKKMFSNSLFLHLCIGLALVSVLGFLTPWIIDYLEIDSDRMETAKMVYLISLLTLFLSFLVAPFRAMFIARENIVYISFIDVLDGLFKVLFVILFLRKFSDQLLTYTGLMSSLMLFNLLALSLYGRLHYEEVCLIPHREYLSKKVLSKITGFAGWTTYSMGCIIFRNQGIAVIFNKAFSTTIINTAYGLAVQVATSANFVSQSILNAMSPLIIKAEGKGDRNRMLILASMASKYAFLLLSMVAIPLIAEMPGVLDLWLGEGRYPEETILFCRFILAAALCDQLTIGLGTANQAIGRIRNYSLTINTLKVLTLPLIILVLVSGYSLYSAMWSYLLIEFCAMILRMFFLKYTAGLSISIFVRQVFSRVFIPFLAMAGVSAMAVEMLDIPYRFVLTLFVTVVVGGMLVWFYACESMERQAFMKMIRRK